MEASRGGGSGWEVLRQDSHSKMRAVLRRSIGSATRLPWNFRALSPSIPVQDLDPRFKSFFHTKLSEGFAYAYQSLCDSLANHDLKNLEDCLEGHLFAEVKARLQDMEKAQMRMKLVAERNPDVSLHNMQVHLGVKIERKENFPKSKYITVANLEDMRKTLSKQPETVTLGNLESMWLYVHPQAPASLVLSLDVLYKGLNPLTVLQNGVDLHPGEFEEVHHLRFESCPVSLGLQIEVIATGSLSQLLAPIRECSEDLINSPWEVVDIEHILKGNPFVV